MIPLYKTLADLIRINSVNAFYDGGPGESDLADYLTRFFHQYEIQTTSQPVISESDNVRARNNIIARLPGRNSNRRVILEAHMDTVSVQGMSIPPFEPTVRDGIMFGRGACDTKAGLAGMMHAMVDIKQHGIIPPCDILLAAVVDEEFSFRGVTKFCEQYRADAAIVAEPTELKLVVASKGVLRWRMISQGKAAHSSKCHLGNNAISHMARVVMALEQDHQRLSNSNHPLLGSASCNVGKIQGGVQVNFVPDQCIIEIDRRMLPGETVDGVLKHYEELLRNLSLSEPTLQVTMETPMLIDEPWTVDLSHPIVKSARQVLNQLGLDSEPAGVPFGSDASKLGRAGIPTIIYGPGSIDQAHTADEFIRLAEVEKAYHFYRQFIASYE